MHLMPQIAPLLQPLKTSLPILLGTHHLRRVAEGVHREHPAPGGAGADVVENGSCGLQLTCSSHLIISRQLLALFIITIYDKNAHPFVSIAGDNKQFEQPVLTDSVTALCQLLGLIRFHPALQH